MKKLSLLSLLLFALIRLSFSQIEMPGRWKFQTGDDATWSQPTFDDSHWQSIDPLKSWEKQGFNGYDGYAWYRTKVFFPKKDEQRAGQFGGFLLHLGRIDDADMVWLNGVMIGSSGSFPPDYQSAWNATRRYSIPVEKIQWGRENSIAIRVYDGGGDGGLYGGPVEFRLAGLDEKLDLKAIFQSEDHILKGPVAKQLYLELSNALEQRLQGVLAAKIASDFGTQISDTVLRITLGKQQSQRIMLPLNNLKPGFYRVECSFQTEGYSRTEHFGFGVEPEKIVSPVDAQPDFALYWKQAKAELAAIDPHYRVVRLDSLCTKKREVFLVEMHSLGNVVVRGWYSVPAKKGVYPAVLLLPGYNTSIRPEDVNYGDDIIGFGLNIRGHGNSRDEINPGFPGFLLHGIADKQTYIYRGAFMDGTRALDFLFGRPEVDKKRIAVEGASQGGALTFAIAALNNDRVAVAVPQIPFLSDFPDYFKIAPWPANEFYHYVEQNEQLSIDNLLNTLSYVDIKNLAPLIKAPVLMPVGLVDEICPPHINFAAYNQLKSPKSYVVYPNLGHELPKEFNKRKMDFIRTVFKQIR